MRILGFLVTVLYGNALVIQKAAWPLQYANPSALAPQPSSGKRAQACRAETQRRPVSTGFTYQIGSRKVLIMSLLLPRRLVSRVLVSLLFFGAVSSFGGAVLAIVFNGAGVPLDQLAGTWFSSVLVLGLILGIIVGGTQLVAAFALLKRHWGLLAAAVAGFAMLIWIFTELAVLGYSWLQSVYFGLGMLELILVLALLGIAPGVVSPAQGSPERLPAP